MSIGPPDTTSNELEAMRRRVDALEREHYDRTARANTAIAAAQDRTYWLDRWNVDLNALMQKRGASEIRVALRATRKLYRFLYFFHYRVRALSLKAQQARRAVEEERGHSEDPSASRFARTLSPDPLGAAPVTEQLFDRLRARDVAAVEAQLQPAEAALWESANPTDRKRLTLAFAAHLGVQPALERTGLSGAMPSESVHSMASGSAAAGGSAYYADLVVDSLAQAGRDLRPGMTGLDFGCSSGRVARVLAAAHPEVKWHGCDPIADAIEWATQNLPGIAFERSPEYPPLPYPDAAFDFGYAISIWSHFAEGAALDWLAEMQRILRPGAHLLLTTHGEQSVSHTWREGLRSEAQLEEIRAALDGRGFWYADEFGETGDHGVANPDWGTAFLTPEWMAAKLTPRWRFALFRPGRVEGNQDLYVLERA